MNMDTRSTEPAAAHGILSAIPDGYMTRAQAAKVIGRSTDTIKRWEDDDLVVPSAEVPMGKLDVKVYDASGILKLKMLAKTMKPGRPKKEAS